MGLFVRRVDFSDNFNRADNADLGASWDADFNFQNAFQILSNGVQATAIAATSQERINAIDGVTWASLSLATFTGAVITGARILLNTRAASPNENDYYWMQAILNSGGNTTVISRISSGSEVVLASESATSWTSGDSMEFESDFNGNFRAYRNGSATPLLSATDTQWPVYRPGMSVYIDTGGTLANVVLDNFQAGALVEPFMLPSLPERREMFC